MRELQQRVAEWVKTRIGADHMHPMERALRLFEEAAELLQSEGVDEQSAIEQVRYVYGRPAGEPEQEAAGVAVCLLAWCESRGVSFVTLAAREIERIEAKPLDQIRGSVTRKADAGLVTRPWEREK